MQNKTRTCKALMLSAAVMMPAAVFGVQATPHISVTVNGTPVQFSGMPPIENHGAVLVPLRGVFEAMGASVDYDSVAKVIKANKGTSSVVLPLGATQATVNGQTQALSWPAEVVGGTALVPLRFVAQALGAAVQWRAASNTVEIRTLEAHLSSLPAPTGTGDVIGQVTGIFTNTNPPQMTLRVNGLNTTAPISSATAFFSAEAGQTSLPLTLSQINVGDQVTVHRGPDGFAQSVTVSQGGVRGTIKSIAKLADGNARITLDDGVNVELAAGAPIVMARRHIDLGDVMPGEEVVIRTSADNKLGVGMAVVTGNNPNPQPPAQGSFSNPASGEISPSTSR